MKKGKRRLLVLLTVLTLFLMPAAVNASESSDKTVVSVKKETKGWHKDGSGKYYYIKADGTRAMGWLTLNGKHYYLDLKGIRVTGWKKISGKYYYFDSKGVRQSGWVTYKSKRYYCDPAQNDARTVGWKKIGSYKYYFNSAGVRVTGWLKLNGQYYYLKTNGRMATGWYTVKGKKYYFDKTTGVRAKGWKKIGSFEYYFTSTGTLLKDQFVKDGNYVDADGKKLKKSTLKEFLQIALQPVGSTMYVFGGGWDVSDKGANIDARTIGVSPQWKKFFNRQTSSYNYQTTRYQTRNGLDCSGFVGWTIYNAFNTKSGNSGYVYLAQTMTRVFSGKGWGSYKAAGAVRDYRPGDIMSTSAGHVYIVLGSCSDGSVVFVHSSPCGVQINGTYTPSGRKDSKAVKLAEKYLKKYYPKWYKKFPKCSRDTSYLTQYSQMRWYLTGNCMMSDPDGYAKKNAEQILKDLFGA